jgi:hypothetical protein
MAVVAELTGGSHPAFTQAELAGPTRNKSIGEGGC